MGGVTAAIEKGFFQKEIADSSYKYQREIEHKQRVLVGVNDYTVEEDWIPVKLLRIHPKVEEEQIARLQRVKKERDNRRVKEVLDKLHDEADRDRNLMPTIIEAVKAYATLGEIIEVLRGVYGEYRELIVV
jgi:methylmalonyl-CoA mutase N-terminal domain/subunit